VNDADARDTLDDTLLISTGTPFIRFRLDADGDDARLEPVEGGDTVTLDWSELSTLYNRGDVYLPQHPGQFGTAVDQLARNAVIIADGGLDQAKANTAASLFDDAAVALREGEHHDARKYIDLALKMVENGGETA
jgi:hypothetical protein